LSGRDANVRPRARMVPTVIVIALKIIAQKKNQSPRKGAYQRVRWPFESGLRAKLEQEGTKYFAAVVGGRPQFLFCSLLIDYSSYPTLGGDRRNPRQSTKTKAAESPSTAKPFHLDLPSFYSRAFSFVRCPSRLPFPLVPCHRPTSWCKSVMSHSLCRIHLSQSSLACPPQITRWHIKYLLYSYAMNNSFIASNKHETLPCKFLSTSLRPTLT